MTIRITTGAANRDGTIPPGADAYTVHVHADGTTAAALVDGIGHSSRITDTAHLLAQVIARTSARRSGLAGLLTATELVADPGADDEPEADAVAIVAVARPDAPEIRLAWVGDCRAYALTDDGLLQLTVDHTVAEQLAMCGYDGGEVVRCASYYVRASIATAAVATVAEAWTDAGLVVLTSDGVHEQVTHETMEMLAVQYRHDPQALAVALVTAAETGPDGVRDDATAVVIRHG